MDETERRLRAARPVSGNRDLPLSDRAKRELAELLIADSRPDPERSRTGTRPRRHSTSWILRSRAMAIAAVLVVAVGVGVLWPAASPSAAAFTPPVLVVTPLEGEGADVLADLAERAGQAADPDASDDPGRPDDVVIRLQSWVLDLALVDDAVDPDSVAVSPEEWTITLPPDGSSETVVVAGQPYDHRGNPVDDGVAPGTPLWNLAQGPGEYAPLFAAAAPGEPGDVGAFLAAGSGLDADERASDAVLAVSYLLREQALDGAQTAALVTFLAGLPDLEVAGATTDRLGRPAVVLTAERPDGEYADHLLLSSETGEVLAVETVYVGSGSEVLTAPAVVEYHAWESD